MSSSQPEQHAPPRQWLRIEYAKRGRARFASHRDFGRAFERALRRAGVPMAYSSGFSPHPRISYANAAPTGAASEAEYLEIGLVETCDPELVRAALDEALPTGLDVLRVVIAPGGALADRLTGSVWDLELADIDPVLLDAAVERLLAADAVSVERMTKTGLRSFDARGAIVRLERLGPGLRLVIRHLVPLVRADDVWAALRQVEPGLNAVQPLLTRVRQGVLNEVSGEVGDPLA